MGGSQAAERAPPSALEELQAKVEKLQERTERHHSVLLTVTGYCVFIATGESHDVSQEELIESLTSTLRGISLSALDAPGEGEVKP